MARHILVIEDNEDLAKLLRLHLCDLSYEVELAFDGQSGLSMAQSGRYDLIILDLMLPVVDGLEVCRQLRANSAYTPILMNGPWTGVITVWVTAAFGFICTASVFEGYLLRRLHRTDFVLLSIAAVGFFIQNIWFNLASFALLALSVLMQRARSLDTGNGAAPALNPAAVQGEIRQS